MNQDIRLRENDSMALQFAIGSSYHFEYYCFRIREKRRSGDLYIFRLKPYLLNLSLLFCANFVQNEENSHSNSN